MHPRTADLLRQLDEHRAHLRETAELVPQALREQRPAPDRWSVAEILEHLSLIERRITALLTRHIAALKADGRSPETEPVVHTLDAPRVLDRRYRIMTAEAGQPRAGLDAAAAWAALEKAREAFREVVLSGDGLPLGDLILPHPSLGPLNGYQWIAFVGLHEARHAAQIQEAAAALSAGRSSEAP